LVITYSHELQHFEQYSTHRKLYEVDELFRQQGKFLGFTKWEDHPIEQEALWKSKTVAVDMYGENPVCEYAESQIHLANSKQLSSEANRWRYFSDVRAGRTFNLAEATDAIIQRFPIQFQRLVSSPTYVDNPILSSLNFSQPTWWA
jgi:hypothetical protein